MTYADRAKIAARSSLSATLVVLMLCACARTSTVVVTATPGSTTVSRGDRVDEGAWPMRVREHVDLWLHGFAMLRPDSSLVPYFRLGYRDEVMAERRRRSLTTLLDTNGDLLRSRLERSPNLLAAQFVPLYFASWTELRRAVGVFMQVQGDARRADRASAQAVTTLATYFGSAAEREWLAVFVNALEDERSRFHAAWWQAEQNSRAPVLQRAISLWRGTYQARFARFLANSRQRDGEILLALSLGGEGRTLVRQNRPTIATVGLPRDPAAAEEVILTLAHEVVGSMVSEVVTDNTSPADRRSGVTDRYISLATVRAGAMLLGRVAPELSDSYARFYLAAAGIRQPGSDVARVFAGTFSIPDSLRDAVERQLDIILSGI